MHKVIRARNVQDAYFQGMKYLKKHGQMSGSRAGAVYVAPGPVMTEYSRPMERVILDEGRDANPFFHLMESFWMLAGRDDVQSISYFNSKMSSFSDDGVIFNAPYGHRWRHRFEFDQIVHVIEQLRQDYATRRAVIQIWDGFEDGRGSSKDYPCNTAVYFRVVRTSGPFNRLDMTISNRSNDIIWGAYGANAVHMSVLQEFVAAFAGCEVGRMYQLSNNYHAYEDIMKRVGEPDKRASQQYIKQLAHTPLFRWMDCRTMDPAKALAAIEQYWSALSTQDWASREDGLRPFMYEEAVQTLGYMASAWWEYKNKNHVEAANLAADIPGEDWARACLGWIERHKPAIVGSQNG